MLPGNRRLITAVTLAQGAFVAVIAFTDHVGVALALAAFLLIRRDT